MSCYVAGAGRRRDGRNRQTVQAGGRTGSGERCHVMMSCGNSATNNMTGADRGFVSSGVRCPLAGLCFLMV